MNSQSVLPSSEAKLTVSLASHAEPISSANVLDKFLLLPKKNDPEEKQAITRFEFFKDHAGLFTKINFHYALVNIAGNIISILDAYFKSEEKAEPQLYFEDVIELLPPQQRLFYLKKYMVYVSDHRKLVSMFCQEDRLIVCDFLIRVERINSSNILSFLDLLTAEQAYEFFASSSVAIERAEDIFRILQHVPEEKIRGMSQRYMRNILEADRESLDKQMQILLGKMKSAAEKERIKEYIYAMHEEKHPIAANMAAISKALAVNSQLVAAKATDIWSSFKARLNETSSTVGAASSVSTLTGRATVEERRAALQKQRQEQKQEQEQLFTLDDSANSDSETEKLVTEIDGVAVDPLAQKPVKTYNNR